MTTNVVTPPRTSAPTVLPRAWIWNQRSSADPPPVGAGPAGRALRAALARAGALRRAGLRLRLRRGAPLPTVRELDALSAGLLHRRGRADPPPAPRADGLHRAALRPAAHRGRGGGPRPGAA